MNFEDYLTEDDTELLGQLNQLARDLRAINAKMDTTNAMLARAANRVPDDHPAADAVEDMQSYASDVQDHVHGANQGVAKLLGLVGGFMAGWKMKS